MPHDQNYEGEFKIAPRFEGCKLKEIPKAILAIRIADSNGILRFTDLETGSMMEIHLSTREKLPPLDTFEKFLQHTLRIVNAFGWDLIYPKQITQSDQENLSVLDEALEHGVAQIGVQDLRATMVRPQTEADQCWQKLNAELRVMLERETFAEELFGQCVSTGPCRIMIDKPTIKDKSKLGRKFLKFNNSTELKISDSRPPIGTPSNSAGLLV